MQGVQAALVSQGVAVSWADLFQLGGAAAVKLTGGPTIDVVMGRKCVNETRISLGNLMELPASMARSC